MYDYQFEIKDGVAKGTMSDGTTFLVDEDMIEAVSKYAFHLNWKGYVYSVKNEMMKHNIFLHWLVLGYEDEKPKVIIDHINRDKTDCRRENLRIVTNQQNAMNRGLGKNNRSGYKGAFYCNHRKRYLGKICINDKRISLYDSQDIIECAQAYNYAQELLFGEFAGYMNPVPEAPNHIKEVVRERCQPYMEEAEAATQRYGRFL